LRGATTTKLTVDAPGFVPFAAMTCRPPAAARLRQFDVGAAAGHVRGDVTRYADRRGR